MISLSFTTRICVFFIFGRFFSIQIIILLEDFSHLSLHDEPDGESDVRSGLSGLTVEGSHDVM